MGVWATLNVYWAMYAREETTASKWAQMPVVEKAFEGARLNPLKPLMSGLVYFVFPHFNITVKRKHGYWTFEYLFSLFLCDTQVHIHTNRY